MSRFKGLVIEAQYRDTGRHNKPNVHAYFGDYAASVGLDGELLAGSLPLRQLRIVAGWLALHEDEVYDVWNKAITGTSFGKIDPLR